MNDALPPSAQRVQATLRALGLAADVIELPDSTRTAGDAATAIGCSVAQIAKSIVFRRIDNDRPVLVIASGTNRVDEHRVAALLGTAIGKADADYVRTATGFAIGGVPPLGHAQPIELVIDQDLLELDTVWAAGGTPRTVFSLTSAQLASATGGRVADIASR